MQHDRNKVLFDKRKKKEDNSKMDTSVLPPPKTKTGFKVPDRHAREKAASLQKAHNNPKLRRLLSMVETHLCGDPPQDHHLFRPIHQPEPGDWLADVREKGQSSAEYIDILTR